jgi:chemotaxis protein MotB
MIKQKMVTIFQTKRGVVVDISASTLFRTGEAELQPGSLDILREVAVVLSTEDMPIEVEGHSDDIPISTAQFPSNWALSSVRASSVAKMLNENGVLANRLYVVGWAANQPLVPNNSAEHRARNRRVTIIVASPNLDWN